MENILKKINLQRLNIYLTVLIRPHFNEKKIICEGVQFDL